VSGPTLATEPRVALIHDFLLDVRGAERVFLAICDMWPDADVFTAIYDEAGTEGRFSHRPINTSFLQRLRPTAKTFRRLLPLYPYAIESLDLRGYDLVVSSSSAWAHGVIVDPGTVHVCYCHNPFRYAWNAREETLSEHGTATRAALRSVFHRWRQWDWIAAQRVDRYVANSHTTERRIARYFSRDSSVVHPPVETERFSVTEPADYYLVISELMPHKRIGVAIDAFNRLRRPLVVVGDGPDARRLRHMAGPTVKFTGRVSDERAAALVSGCRAMVVTATEEFGIAAVEAQAAGRPVVALAEGGARETVVDGVTGTFFGRCDAESVELAVRAFDPAGIDPADCVANARRFDTTQFSEGLRAVVEEARQAERPPRPVTQPRARGRLRSVTVGPSA
jgi:glycosyltransferase involved in cell wall biosynthesis